MRRERLPAPGRGILYECVSPASASAPASAQPPTRFAQRGLLKVERDCSRSRCSCGSRLKAQGLEHLQGAFQPFSLSAFPSSSFKKVTHVTARSSRACAHVPSPSSDVHVAMDCRGIVAHASEVPLTPRRRSYDLGSGFLNQNCKTVCEARSNLFGHIPVRSLKRRPQISSLRQESWLGVGSMRFGLVGDSHKQKYRVSS